MTGEIQDQGDAVFFDCRGKVHYEYAPGQTIAKLYYLKVLQHFVMQLVARDQICGNRKDLSQLISHFLAKKGIPVVRQAPYSPDMTPSDFWLFPKIKQQLKGFRF